MSEQQEQRSLIVSKISVSMYRLISYLFEGFVFFVVLMINKKQAITMSLMIASTLSVLDAFTMIGHTARQGMGYGIGFGLVGFPKM